MEGKFETSGGLLKIAARCLLSYDKGTFTQAAKICIEILKSEPENIQAAYGLALCYFLDNQGYIDLKKLKNKNIIGQYKYLAELKNMYGHREWCDKSDFVLSKLNKESNELQNGIAYFVKIYIARQYMFHGSYITALNILGKAKLLFPEFQQEYLYLKLSCHNAVGSDNHKEVIKEVAEGDKVPRVRRVLAISLLELREWQQLMEELIMLIQDGFSDSTDIAISSYRAMCKLSEEQRGIFLAKLRELTPNPLFVVFWASHLKVPEYTGRVLSESKQDKELQATLNKALQHIEEALVRYPNCIDFYYTKADILYFQNRFDEAIALLGKAIEIQNGDLSDVIYLNELNIYPDKLMMHSYCKRALGFTKKEDLSELERKMMLFDFNYYACAVHNFVVPDHLPKDDVIQEAAKRVYRLRHQRSSYILCKEEERLCNDITKAINNYFKLLGFPDYYFDKCKEPSVLSNNSMFAGSETTFSTSNYNSNSNSNLTLS